MEEIELLKTYNTWRRGAEIEMPDPKHIGRAIDVVTKKLELMIEALENEDLMSITHENIVIGDTGDYDTLWHVNGYREGEKGEVVLGYGKTPSEALLDSQKSLSDPTKWDYDGTTIC